MSGYQQLSISTPKARKEHQCIWCGEPIKVGEVHTSETGIYEGHFQSGRWHTECVEATRGRWSQHDPLENEFEPYNNPRGYFDWDDARGNNPEIQCPR